MPDLNTHIHAGAWLPVVATNARTLDCQAGPCHVCGWAMLPGQRAADLPDGQTVHVAGCAAKTTGGQP
ncbi:MAG TPA: hypothetical protein VGS19_23850 [Streptosporangiaceae bacterium]|nr:hypothetical protein [Streptosporangiaceae bacterium]